MIRVGPWSLSTPHLALSLTLLAAGYSLVGWPALIGYGVGIGVTVLARSL